MTHDHLRTHIEFVQRVQPERVDELLEYLVSRSYPESGDCSPLPVHVRVIDAASDGERDALLDDLLWRAYPTLVAQDS